MPVLDRITAFSFRRQGLDGGLPTALAALEATVGVYSSMPSGPLSIRARARAATPDEVRALETGRRAIRMRAMRTSAFLVPRSWAARVAAATDVPPGRFAWLMRAAGIADDDLGAVRAAVRAVAATPGTPAELRDRLAASDGVGTPGDGQRAWTSGAALGRVLSLLTAFGDLVAIGGESLSSNALRYVDRAAWLAREPGGSAAAPEPPDGPVDPAEARAWLAGAYLERFGPARIEDLAWWAGWTRVQAAAAIGVHDTVDVGGGLLLAAGDLPAFEASEPLPMTLTLLPKWDPWTMGYPLGGRDRFLDRATHDRVFDGDGNGLGMVLRAGRAIGAWAHRGERGLLAADLDLFEPVRRSERAAIEAELASIATFLAYRGAAVRDVPTVVPNRRRQRRPLEG